MLSRFDRADLGAASPAGPHRLDARRPRVRLNTASRTPASVSECPLSRDVSAEPVLRCAARIELRSAFGRSSLLPRKKRTGLRLGVPTARVEPAVLPPATRSRRPRLQRVRESGRRLHTHPETRERSRTCRIAGTGRASSRQLTHDARSDPRAGYPHPRRRSLRGLRLLTGAMAFQHHKHGRKGAHYP